MRKVLVGTIVWLGVIVPVAGQGHGDAHGAPEKSAPAAAVKPAASAPAKPAASAPAKEEAPAAKAVTEPEAKKAAPAGASPSDLKALADRINQKVAAARAGSPAKATSTIETREPVTPATARTARPRVTLDWRVPLVWPDELLTDR